MELKKVKRIVNAGLILSGIIYFLGLITDYGFVCVISIVIVVGTLVFWARFLRCPHCEKQLYRIYGDYCQFCGARLDT